MNKQVGISKQNLNLRKEDISPTPPPLAFSFSPDLNNLVAALYEDTLALLSVHSNLLNHETLAMAVT